MSGPKSGIYRLTREQRAIMKELQERQFQLESEYQKIVEYCDGIEKMGHDFALFLEQTAEFAAFAEQTGGYVVQVKVMRERAFAELEKYRGHVSKGDLKELCKKGEALGVFYEEMRDLHRKMERKRVSLAEEYDKDVAVAVKKGMSLNFDALGREYRYQIQALLEETAGMDLSVRLREKERQIRKRLEGDADEAFLKTYCSLTVQPFVKECRVWQEEEALYGEEWRELKRTHAILAEMAGVPDRSEAVVERAKEAVERFREVEGSKETIKWLREENLRLEQKIEKEQEQAYISNMMDEVMEEMGYLLIGSKDVVKKSGKRFRNELYTFAEGTAVNVTTGEDGQITMELGKTDTVDRMPDAQESRQLCWEMENFCGEFDRIRKELERRGIVADDLSMLPAKEEFAQIINTSEYRMEEENKGRADKGRRKKESGVRYSEF